MTKLTILASTALALSVSILPLTANVDLGGVHFSKLSAFAKDGSSGSGGGGGSGRGGGDSDSDSDNDGGGSSGSGGGDSDNSGSGSSGSGRSGSDDRDSDDDDGDDDNGGRHGAEHVDPATGAKVEASGSSIEVRYANGVKEELENGRYEMKDASGRTIVERVATPEDIARLTDLAN